MSDKVQFLSKNTLGRDFVVGDLHGCYDDLIEFLKLIDFDFVNDRLISVGDLIDRGPESMKCVDLCYEPWFFAVRGNHEDMMIKTILQKDYNSKDTWFWNGGQWANDHHETELHIAATRLNELPLVIVVGDASDRYNVVHADLSHSSYVDENDVLVTDLEIDQWAFAPYEEDNMMWGRRIIGSRELLQDPDHMSVTFVGHTPVLWPVRSQQQVYVDTGACFYHTGGKASERHALTMACPTDGHIYSMNMMHWTITKSPINEVKPSIPPIEPTE